MLNYFLCLLSLNFWTIHCCKVNTISNLSIQLANSNWRCCINTILTINYIHQHWDQVRLSNYKDSLNNHLYPLYQIHTETMILRILKPWWSYRKERHRWNFIKLVQEKQCKMQKWLKSEHEIRQFIQFLTEIRVS